MLVRQCLIFFCISVFANSVTLACNPFRLFETPVHQNGHHVSVRVDGEHICSGSIISSRFILTSHLCIFMHTWSNITVVAGTNSLTSGGDSYEIEKVITPESLSDDIALLRTEKNIIFHNDIQKLSIANHNSYEDDFELSVTGWEHPSNGGEPHSDMLQQLSAKLYNKTACREIYDSNIEKHMCIYDPNGGEICNAEKGGAIVANGTQIGIYTQENWCYNASEPRTHTSVYAYVEWIKNNTILEDDGTLPSTSPPTLATTLPPSVKGKEIDHDAPAGAYPYHVSIRHNDQHVCSGSIINKRFILTSINCIMRYAPWTLTVMVGINSLNETGAIHDVNYVIPHSIRKYDVAIIHLATDIIFNDRVKYISIVKYSEGYGKSRKITLTGWQRKDTCGSLSNKLQHVQFQILAGGKCKQLIPFLNPVYMCSLEESSHTCNIDYGGPIVSGDTQIALNPFSVGCGERFQPHLHFPLYKVATWIERHSYVEN